MHHMVPRPFTPPGEASSNCVICGVAGHNAGRSLKGLNTIKKGVVLRSTAQVESDALYLYLLGALQHAPTAIIIQ